MKNTAVVGRVSSQPCWRMARKNVLQAGDGVFLHRLAGALAGHPRQIAFQQRPVDAGQRVDGRAARSRNRLNLLTTVMSVTTVLTVSPESSRCRAQRLASSRSQGWVIRSKRRWLRAFSVFPGLRVSPGRVCSRQTSRGYSTSHPVPSRPATPRRRGRASGNPDRSGGLARGQCPPAARRRGRAGWTTPASAAMRIAQFTTGGRRGDALLVVAALDGVLELQLQLRRQAAKVDAGLAALQAVGRVSPRPPGGPAGATGSGGTCRTGALVLDPQGAERQPALAVSSTTAGPRRPRPPGPVAGAGPAAAVSHAQP